MLSLFNISHFSSTVWSDTMAKRSQQDSGEERVTAKSRPMMNRIARTPSFVSSSTSVSPGKRYYGKQDPWKSVVGEDRLGQLGYSENFVMGSDAAEFVNKVKDQVRNRRKRMSNVAVSGEEHSIIWRMFMATTLNAATSMGKNFSTIQSFVKNSEDLMLNQMLDVTAQLVNDQEEINGLDCGERILGNVCH